MVKTKRTEDITEDIHSHSIAIEKQNQDYYDQIESK